jgi:lipid-binding SYLF domain-containing protein
MEGGLRLEFVRAQSGRRNSMIRGFVMAALAASVVFAAEETPDARLQRSAEVFNEIMATPDRGIPTDLLNKAQCVVIIPGMKKGAFIVGGEFGKGFAMCRHEGTWTGPAAIKLTGGSFGFQIGGSSTDLVMLVMNQHGMNRLMGDKFTIGADASAAAGPVGRTASADTDASLNAEILSWSRSKGAFAGISLDGAAMAQDGAENRRLYGRDVTNREIISGAVPPAPAGQVLASALNNYASAGNADRTR